MKYPLIITYSKFVWPNLIWLVSGDLPLSKHCKGIHKAHNASLVLCFEEIIIGFMYDVCLTPHIGKDVQANNHY